MSNLMPSVNAHASFCMDDFRKKQYTAPHVVSVSYK